MKLREFKHAIQQLASFWVARNELIKSGICGA
jgi:hypothetical protein